MNITIKSQYKDCGCGQGEDCHLRQDEKTEYMVKELCQFSDIMNFFQKSELHAKCLDFLGTKGKRPPLKLVQNWVRENIWPVLYGDDKLKLVRMLQDHRKSGMVPCSLSLELTGLAVNGMEPVSIRKEIVPKSTAGLMFYLSEEIERLPPEEQVKNWERMPGDLKCIVSEHISLEEVCVFKFDESEDLPTGFEISIMRSLICESMEE